MCNSCGDDLKEGLVNHVIRMGDSITIVEGVPAQICTQCGEYYFVTSTMMKLQEIKDKIKNNNFKYTIMSYDVAI